MHSIGEIRRGGQLFHLCANLCLWSGLMISGERYLVLRQSDLPILTAFAVLLICLSNTGMLYRLLSQHFSRILRSVRHWKY